MTPAPGDDFAGFTIERELGSGGMGVVFLARHPRLPRRVALKLLRTDLGSDPSFVGRFQREAETVARLDHPNIVSIDDSGAENGQLWISMRFVDGTNAAEAIASYAAGMPPERAVNIIEKVASALDFAHRHRVVHRDVKPANILLTTDQDERVERVFLTDFGVAKAMDEIDSQATSLTAAGGVVATLDYAAPEQIEAKTLDGRCDIFALGCVLYKLLTGVIPYPGENLAAKVYTRLHQPPPAPSTLVPTLPAAFDDIIRMALARDPDDRYQTCKAMAVAARGALTGAIAEPTSTIQIPPPQPAQQQPAQQHQPGGYSSPESLPPELAALLGPGMRPAAGPPGPDDSALRQRRTRRRSLAAIGGVALVATMVVGISLVHRSQVAGNARIADRAAATHLSTPSGPSLQPVAGLPHSAPLPTSTLVVSRQYGKSFALYLLDSITGKVGQRITPESAHAQNPLLSLERGSIIYQQGDATGGAIRTVAADGSGDRLLFAKPAGCSSIGRPAWDQADPQLLAITCGLAGGQVSLQLVDLTGLAKKTLPTGLAVVDDLTFSPDGTRIGYWGSTNPQAGDGGLYLQAVDGLSTPVSITPARGHDADCDFSPDGTQITFRRVVTDGAGSHPRIAIAAASGSAPATVFAAEGQGPVWSPDGKQIAYKDGVPATGGTTKQEVKVLTVAAPDQPRSLAQGDGGSVVGSPIWGPR